MLAITHLPSPNMANCQLTYVAREPIDYAAALRQHEGYRRMLDRCGATSIVLETNMALPDACFVEDTAIVLDELGIMMSMGAESRRPEPAGIEPELRKHRPIARVALPATIDGGDVTRVGKTLLVGRSQRTNAAGAAALAAIVAPFGYRVKPITVIDCLHLKSACTALPDDRLLINPRWLDIRELADFDLIEIPPQEQWAADVLSIGQHVCLPASTPRTAELIDQLGFDVETTDLSEFAKAEGGVTCLSLVVR
ncbi:MAG TPA: arginine deiminase family protein [Humisphaera sp.]|jgi:dimethylargininase|nr:arginine deiminase family protein [Humisphaera sp.]